MGKLQEHEVRPALPGEEETVILGISLMILLSGNFTFRYVGYTYFVDGILDVGSPGFWLLIFNAIFISLIVLLNKRASEWTWSHLGLRKQDKWWKTPAIAAALIIIVLAIFTFLKPVLNTFTSEPDISHLMVIKGDLQVFILALVMVWVTAVILVEIVFRAFLINVLDVLLGRTNSSPWIAVVISSFIFGMMHAWQGFGGVILTGTIGLIFGITFILNGRRIWSIILAHGILNTLTLVSIYTQA